MTARKGKPFVWILLAVAVIGAGGYLAVKSISKSGDVIPAVETATADAMTQSEPAAGPEDTSPIPTQKLETGMGLGNPDAPVKMHEFSSLTCSHCGAYHKETYKKLREEYIRTGKVYFILTDFPLNRPALDGALIAHCLPEDKYFSFVDLLFDNQEQWAYSNEYVTHLRQSAKLAGMDDATFDACMADDAKRQAIIDRMQEASKKWNVQATPTFVFNDGQANLSGALPYDAFQKTIADLTAAKAAPAEAVPSGPAGSEAVAPEPAGGAAGATGETPSP